MKTHGYRHDSLNALLLIVYVLSQPVWALSMQAFRNRFGSSWTSLKPTARPNLRGEGMLTIEPIHKNNPGYCLTYANTHFNTDYYLGGDCPGLWHGQGAKLLGLTGKIQREDFDRIFAGFAPDGSPLVQNAGKPRHVPGFDLVWSVPKSLSILCAYATHADCQHIERCILDSARTAVDRVEREYAFSRRGKDGKQKVPAKLISGLWLHVTSREGDPQWHVHTTVAGACLRLDGSSGSLMDRPLFRMQRKMGAFFRQALAQSLQRELGLKLTFSGSDFEVAGVPKSLCRDFSKRTVKIEDYKKKHGITNPAKAAKVSVYTRPPKQKTAPRYQLFADWRSQGKAHGFTVEDARKLIHPERTKARMEPHVKPDPSMEVVPPRPVNRVTEINPINLSPAKPQKTLPQRDARESTKGPVTGKSTVPTVKRTPVPDDRTESKRRAKDPYSKEHTKAPLKTQVHTPERKPEKTKSKPKDRRTPTNAGFNPKALLKTVDALLTSINPSCKSQVVTKVIKQHSEPRNPILLEAGYHLKELVKAGQRRKTHPIDRDLVRRFAPHTITPQESLLLSLFTQPLSRIHVLKQDAIARKDWFLHLSQQCWERSGHRVLGVSMSRKGAVELQRTSGIRSVTFKGLDFMMNPPVSYQVKYHARQLLCKAVTGRIQYRLRPFRITKDTVLVFNRAETIPLPIMARLLKQVQRQGGKILLVEGRQPYPGEPSRPLDLIFDRVYRRTPDILRDRHAPAVPVPLSP